MHAIYMVIVLISEIKYIRILQLYKFTALTTYSIILNYWPEPSTKRQEDLLYITSIKVYQTFDCTEKSAENGS